jgi:predicted nicotinamide N-methyase
VFKKPPVLLDKHREEFIRAETKLSSPPLVPEIRLHLASDSIALWKRTEDFAEGQLPPPYWAFAWPGGQALARYLIDHPDEMKGKCVLDFGSGSGLTAIAAAKASAATVCAVEIDALALAAIEMNAQANAVFIEPLSRDLIGERGRWNTVLCGDMCYERPLAERLVPWLKNLAADGMRVLMGDPGRNYFPREMRDLELRPLKTYTVATTRDLENRDARETTVYCLAAK